MVEVTKRDEVRDPHVTEAQRQARLWYWASFLTEHNFTVSMDTKGTLRATCIGCGRCYKSRYKHAQHHLAKCPMPNVAKTGQVVARIDVPSRGDRLELNWIRQDGSKVHATAQIMEVR